jgi:hypothetical protein
MVDSFQLTFATFLVTSLQQTELIQFRQVFEDLQQRQNNSTDTAQDARHQVHGNTLI